MPTKILKANSANKEELCVIYQEFIDDTHSSQPEDIGTSFDNFITKNFNHIILIYSNNELAGFAEFRDLPRKLRDKNQKVEITSLFIRAKFRKLGLGTKLIKYIADYAVSTGKDRLVLYSGLELEEAHKFYEKLGFEKKALFFEKKVTYSKLEGQTDQI